VSSDDNKQRQKDAERRHQDAVDYNAEITGAEIGRIRRFLSPEAREAVDKGKNGKSKDKMDLLDILLLTDPIYRKLYTDIMEEIELLTPAIGKALDAAAKQIAAMQQTLSDIQDQAYVLSDGRRAYRAKNGAVFAEDGRKIEGRDAQNIVWEKHHPAWETFTGARDNLTQANGNRQKIEDCRDHVATVKDRLYDRENPADTEELREIFSGLKEKAPASVRQYIAAPEKTADLKEISPLVAQFRDKVATASGETGSTPASSPPPFIPSGPPAAPFVPRPGG
jgi:hypothetical protein